MRSQNQDLLIETVDHTNDLIRFSFLSPFGIWFVSSMIMIVYYLYYWIHNQWFQKFDYGRKIMIGFVCICSDCHSRFLVINWYNHFVVNRWMSKSHRGLLVRSLNPHDQNLDQSICMREYNTKVIKVQMAQIK